MGNVGLGVFFLVFGAVTKNWNPLIEVVENSNKISTGFKLCGIGAAKIVNKVRKN